MWSLLLSSCVLFICALYDLLFTVHFFSPSLCSLSSPASLTRNLRQLQFFCLSFFALSRADSVCPRRIRTSIFNVSRRSEEKSRKVKSFLTLNLKQENQLNEHVNLRLSLWRVKAERVQLNWRRSAKWINWCLSFKGSLHYIRSVYPSQRAIVLLNKVVKLRVQNNRSSMPREFDCHSVLKTRKK